VKILLLPCEVGVKTVLPAIKALIARDIMENYGMKEKQVAEILGLSQSAISRYTTRNRGNILILENELEVKKIVSQMTTFLIYEPHKKKEIFELFCSACTTIRKKGLMCELCKERMNKKWAESCNFCKST
jgi:predicted transcriptional regulator